MMKVIKIAADGRTHFAPMSHKKDARLTWVNISQCKSILGPKVVNGQPP